MLCNAPVVAALTWSLALHWISTGFLPSQTQLTECFNPFRVIQLVSVDSHTLTMYRLWICLCGPEKGEHAFSSRRLSLEFFFFLGEVTWWNSGYWLFNSQSHWHTQLACDNAVQKMITFTFEAGKQESNHWRVSGPALFISHISGCGTQWTQNFCNKTHNNFNDTS